MKSFYKILLLLDKPVRLKSVYMFLLILIGMILEMLGIGLFIPIIMAILEPEFIENFPKIQYFLNNSLNISNSQIVVFILVLLIIFYIIKTIYMTFLAFQQGHFIYGIRDNLAKNLFQAYPLWYTLFINSK